MYPDRRKHWFLGDPCHDEDSCDTTITGSPFLGPSDPDARYYLRFRFIDEMVLHHRGAIVSTEKMIADFETPKLRNLAQRIQQDQQQQIDQMLA